MHHSKIYKLKSIDLIDKPFEMHFGNQFGGLYAIGYRYKDGKIVDILFNPDHTPVEIENNYTRKIKSLFTYEGKEPQFAQCLIDGQRCIAIKLPIII